MSIVTWSSISGSTANSFYVDRSGKRQIPFDPSFKPPLAYYSRALFLGDSNLGAFGRPCGNVFWGEVSPTHLTYSGFDSATVDFTTDGMLAYARAYNKFKDKCYTQASSLTALSERVKTVDMVLARLKQLVKGATALKKGRFKEFTSTFGITPLKKHRDTNWTRPKQFGTLWLEYWMGWAPTVGDVYNCIDALSGSIPTTTIRAGSSVPISQFQDRAEGTYRATSSFEGKGTVWISGQVEITNPSLHTLQTVGLLNPFKTLWETTAFSWFADWFTNVGQILGQITDWVGLQLKNTVISVKTEATSSWLCTGADGLFGPSYPSIMYHTKNWFWFSRHVISSGSLPTVTPIFRLPNGLSLSRGATLASLLVTIFSPSRR